jgi:hypothetical protein
MFKTLNTSLRFAHCAPQFSLDPADVEIVVVPESIAGSRQIENSPCVLLPVPFELSQESLL